MKKQRTLFPENLTTTEDKIPEIIETKEIISLPKYKIKELSEKLIECVKENNIPKINELLREGADINYVQEWSGKNIVRIAVDNDKIEVVRILALNGADLNKLDRDNQDTCLISAVKRQSIDMIETIIKAKIILDARDNLKNTPLMWACGKNNIQIVSLILKEYSCNVNAQNDRGNTALIYATINRNYDIVKLLIEHGADKNIKNDEGKTACNMLTLECLNGCYSNIFELLE